VETQKLSASFYQQMDALKLRYPTPVALMLPALHRAQEEIGWLPPWALDAIATYLDVTPAQVREVGSFYVLYHFEPKGKHVLRVCTNVACCLRGADELVKKAEEYLGCRCGETSEDGLFTLLEEECLGACGTAPVMMTDQGYVEDLSWEKLKAWMDQKRQAHHD
jgi:NADH-quinone oxidoreductase subunit E